MNPTQPMQNAGGMRPGAAPLRPAASIRPAGFWIRFLAAMIDGLIVGVVTYPLSFLLHAVLGIKMVVTDPNQINPGFWAAQGIVMAASLVVTLAYFAYFYSQKGWSPGKKVFGLEVVNAQNGTRLSVGQAIGREVAKFFGYFLLFITFIVLAFRSDKRGIHDLLAGSRVIRKDQ